jgi:hypothetical protein
LPLSFHQCPYSFLNHLPSTYFINTASLHKTTLLSCFIAFLFISGWKCQGRSVGVRLDRNSCPISALSGLHHRHSQQAVHTDSWEICSGLQQDDDECKFLFSSTLNRRVVSKVREYLLSFGAEIYVLQFLFQNIQFRTHSFITLPVGVHRLGNWSLTFREKYRIGCWERYLGLRGMSWNCSGKDYITKSSTTRQILFGW